MTFFHATRVGAAIVLAMAAASCEAETNTSSDSAPDAQAGGSGGTRIGADASASPTDANTSEASPDAGALNHQFTVGADSSMRWGLPECQNGLCATGTCYHLSNELSVCDQPQPDPYAGDCTAPDPWVDTATFECGCDGGTCAADRACAALEFPWSGAPFFTSKCVEPACAVPADCPSDTVCVPASMIGDTRCVQARCSKDSDCVAGVDGRCAAVYDPPLQAGEWALLGVFCVYEDASGPPGCSDAHSLYQQGVYYCP